MIALWDENHEMKGKKAAANLLLLACVYHQNGFT